jgi:hypothetical protein
MTKELTAAEEAKAQKDGEKEAVKEVAKEAAIQEARLDTGTEGEIDPTTSRFLGSDEIMLFEPILDLDPDAFEERISEKHEPQLAENKVYGLLALERNGKNRTPYVKAMMKRLNLKKEELPGGGPAYTNDVTPTSAL